MGPVGLEASRIEKNATKANNCKAPRAMISGWDSGSTGGNPAAKMAHRLGQVVDLPD